MSEDVQEDLVVETASGRLRGAYSGGVYSFKGIPYAGSTAGAQRFRPPVAVEPWVGIRDATAYGASCPQPMNKVSSASPRREIYAVFGMPWNEPAMSEGCLFLNVWSANVADASKAPVMVRIHGGGYSMGSGSWDWHDGANLARDGSVVVVTVNHRLGILGYLHLDEISSEFAGSGNLGQLDLVAALRWVRENISRFGGDPENVTIFGESGGGGKICHMFAMPEARPLFRKAIIQSGALLMARASSEATEVTVAVMERLGVSDPIGLQDVSVEQLIDAQIATNPGGTPGRSTMQFGPVLDTRILPSHPSDAIQAGAAKGIPILVGTTAQEVNLFRLLATAASPDEYELVRQPHLDDLAW